MARTEIQQESYMLLNVIQNEWQHSRSYCELMHHMAAKWEPTEDDFLPSSSCRILGASEEPSKEKEKAIHNEKRALFEFQASRSFLKFRDEKAKRCPECRAFFKSAPCLPIQWMEFIEETHKQEGPSVKRRKTIHRQANPLGQRIKNKVIGTINSEGGDQLVDHRRLFRSEQKNRNGVLPWPSNWLQRRLNSWKWLH